MYGLNIPPPGIVLSTMRFAIVMSALMLLAMHAGGAGADRDLRCATADAAVTLLDGWDDPAEMAPSPACVVVAAHIAVVESRPAPRLAPIARRMLPLPIGPPPAPARS
jgi:hypothetical protein